MSTTWLDESTDISPQSDVFLILYQSHHRPVHGAGIRGVPDVEVQQGPAPLLHQQLQPVPAAAGHAAPSHVQVLYIPARQPHQCRVGDSLAAPNIKNFQLVRLLQNPLNLLIIHSVKVSSLVNTDCQLFKVGEARAGHLLPDRHVREAEHGVGGSELGQHGATLLELLDVDEDSVS